MPIDNPNVVDVISVARDSHEVVLTVSDHLSWDDEDEHLEILQQKLNTYLSFVESGEINASYPSANGRKIVFKVVGQYEVPESAHAFRKAVQEVLDGLGIELRFERLVDNSDN